MKRLVRISGLMLALLIATTAIMPAQRGMRGMGPGRMQGRPDSIRMERMQHVMDSAHFRGQMRNMGPMGRMAPGHMQRPGRFPGWYPQMGPGYGMMPGRPGRWGYQPFPMRPGMYAPPFSRGMRPQMADSLIRGRMGDRMLYNIPGLTDKQKTEIESLRKAQQTEMEKFRADFSAKMKAFREDHRSKVMGILTDEQKKSLGVDSKPAAPAPAAPKSKSTK
jgi:hypothetical protein